MATRELSGKARVCGIIGDPVTYSMSPTMHNAAFAHLGLDFVYVPFKVTAAGLRDALRGVLGLGIRGLNVTVPHKEAVIPFLDRIEPLAAKIGAVNTIANEGGVLLGENTDAPGFLRALRERNVDPTGQSLVVLGAGGASRAISLVLAERCLELTICNRTPARGRQLAEAVSSLSPARVSAAGLGSEQATWALARADILVNATSVGMGADATESPIQPELLRPGMVVVDIVYNPPRTRLLQHAEAAGARAIGGIDMLVWQGALAFERWTGMEAPVSIMRRAVLRRLG